MDHNFDKNFKQITNGNSNFFHCFYLKCIFVLMGLELAGGQCYESFFMEEAILNFFNSFPFCVKSGPSKKMVEDIKKIPIKELHHFF